MLLGIVAADANNGKGVAGVSYDAGLVIIKASIGDTKSFSTETLAQAYTWLMTNSGAQTNAQRNNVRVINMSVGGKGSIDSDDVLYQKITQAKNAGILTVCAAGNADAEQRLPLIVSRETTRTVLPLSILLRDLTRNPTIHQARRMLRGRTLRTTTFLAAN